METESIPGFRDGRVDRYREKAIDTTLDYHRAKHVTQEDSALAALKDGVSRATNRWGSPIEHARQGSYKRAAQAGGGLVNTVLTITLAAVFAYIGVFVLQQTDDSIDTTANTGFDNATDSVSSGVESGFSLFQVVVIALFLGIIVTALIGLRPQG